jgi:hypothetical protein
MSNPTAIQNPGHSLGRMNQLAALGPSFFTPSQQAFRRAAKGYDADAADYGDTQGHHALNKLTYNNYDGTCTMSQMDTTDSGWFDSGGTPPGKVTGAGRI